MVFIVIAPGDQDHSHEGHEGSEFKFILFVSFVIFVVSSPLLLSVFGSNVPR